MARTGRPPKPAEVKRATGNPGKRPIPKLAEVTVLPMAPRTPPPPDGLGDDGVKLWNSAWGHAITWLSPDSDWHAITLAAQLADDLAAARSRYRVTTDPADGRILVNLSKAYADALSALGFDPTSRSRLGVAEVRKASALDELLARRSERQAKQAR